VQVAPDALEAIIVGQTVESFRWVPERPSRRRFRIAIVRSALAGRGAGGQSGVRDFVDGIAPYQRQHYGYLEACAESAGDQAILRADDEGNGAMVREED